MELHEMTDEDLFGKVFGNEVTCRAFLKIMETRGLQIIGRTVDGMSHEECIDVAVGIIRELKMREGGYGEGSKEGSKGQTNYH